MPRRRAFRLFAVLLVALVLISPAAAVASADRAVPELPGLFPWFWSGLSSLLPSVLGTSSEERPGTDSQKVDADGEGMTPHAEADTEAGPEMDPNG